MNAIIAMISIGMLVYIIGYAAAYADEPWAYVILYFFGLIMIIWALHDGAYWSIFPRGHGFFTANRCTALLLFAFLLAGPAALQHLRPIAKKDG